jgi:Ca2+-binding RTX toxin-like protein
LRGDNNTAANELTGGDGNDTYWLGLGDKVVEVATTAGGSDTIYTSVMSIDLNFPDFANAENVTLRGSIAGLNATGNSAANVLSGEFNTTGNTLNGGDGDDTYNVGLSDTVVEAATTAGGIDTINTSAISIDLTSLSFANAENVSLTGAASGLNATGSAANNTLRGDLNSTVNTLTGLDGNDIYYVGAGDIVVEAANGGIDSVYSFSSSFTLSANVENGLVFGAATGLNITGNSGDNRLFADQNANANVLTGGDGNDTYTVGTGDRVVELLTGGYDRVITSEISIDATTAEFANIEEIELRGALILSATGNAGSNVIFAEGNTAANILTGLAGDDRYVIGAGDTIVELANGGNDTVFSNSISLNLASYANVESVHIIGSMVGLNAIGNAGNNMLSGEDNATANSLTGLAGNDTYRVGAGDKIFETATGGNDTVASGTMNLNLASYANVENIQLDGSTAWSATGNIKANTINGEFNSAANVLSGLAGDDTYFVGAGDKIIETATGGRDTVVSSTIGLDLRSANYVNVEQAVLQGTAAFYVTGNAKSNLLQGNDGNNIIWGGAGNDTLTGGAGRDTFAFKTVSDSGTTNASRDVITDFVHGADRIDLSVIDANAKVAGNQAFSFLAAKGAAFTGRAGQLHYVASGANTLIEADTNGDGVADFQLFLIGSKILTGSDFIL